MTGKYVEEMTDQVIELTRCYALWWYFLNKPNTKRYAKVERNYPEFFITIADSLRQSFCIVTYRLFDRRHDVKSLIHLVDRLESSNPPLAKELRWRLESKAALINKVIHLRHKVFGHRDRAQSPKDVFSEVKLKPSEMEAIVRLAQGIISAVVAETKRDLEAELRSHEDAVRSDAHDLMQALVKYTDQ